MSESDYAAESSDEEYRPENGIQARNRSKRHTRASGTLNRNAANVHVPGTKGYSWEDEYQRSWDIVQEDEEGGLAGVVAGLVLAGKKQRLKKDTTPLQRGIIRHVVYLLDMSSAMNEKDLRPTRYILSIDYSIDFILEFFEQNPISQLSIIGMKDGIAIPISSLSSNPHEHISALKQLKSQEPSGDPSLQNALESARATLSHTPSHGTREILIVFGALLSSDPGDIHQTISNLAQHNIHVSVIGLAARVSVLDQLCAKCNPGDLGAYGVILNETHYKDLLVSWTIPPAMKESLDASEKGSTIVRMGFPSRASDLLPSMCSCHSTLSVGGYYCPDCGSKVCNLPSECPLCGLTLILSTHLARSYHHLFPLVNWYEVNPSDKRSQDKRQCFACQAPFSNSLATIQRPQHKMNGKTSSTGAYRNEEGAAMQSFRYACPSCENHFCIDCDVFAHESLHNCPGCEATKTIINKC